MELLKLFVMPITYLLMTIIIIVGLNKLDREVLQMILDKLRINVMGVALIVMVITIDFGDKIIEKLPDEISSDVLTALIGVAIGGLIMAMGRMFDSPSVPAETHERTLGIRRDD